MDVIKLIDTDKPYNANSAASKYIRKVVRAKRCIRAVNPEFVKSMDIIRENFGPRWNENHEKGSYEAWDNAILAIYKTLPEDKKYPGGIDS